MTSTMAASGSLVLTSMASSVFTVNVMSNWFSTSVAWISLEIVTFGS